MIIYKATNLVNGRVYIGLTTRSLEIRIKEHITESRLQRTNMIFCKAIRKYGIENFSWEVIYEGNTYEDLENKERYYIEFYDSYKNGYNETLGGGGAYGYKFSKETREKISKAMTGSRNHRYGKPSPNRGKKMSDDTRRKLSESLKGRKVKPFTEEHIRNMSLSQQGEKGSSAKLTELEVIEIRKLYKSGKYTQKLLGERFGVSRGNIYDIVNYRTWKHI